MKGQGQGPLRSVVRIGDRGKGQSPRFVILLECGHTVGRQLCRFGYNREANDRAHCVLWPTWPKHLASEPPPYLDGDLILVFGTNSVEDPPPPVQSPAIPG